MRYVWSVDRGVRGEKRETRSFEKKGAYEKKTNFREKKIYSVFSYPEYEMYIIYTYIFTRASGSSNMCVLVYIYIDKSTLYTHETVCAPYIITIYIYV